LGAFAKIDSVLAVLKLDAVALNPEVSEMLDRRLKARENRDFKQADALRRKIEKLGFTVLDTKDGYDVRYI
jgi:cysteinyl-tRNA synthetase